MLTAEAARNHAELQALPALGSLSPNPSRILVLWLLGMAIAALPLWIAPVPPLAQHFFNIVRMAILADPAAFARDFVVHWGVIPDLAMDLTVPWLVAFMPVE
jgi:hypothetical protein